MTEMDKHRIFDNELDRLVDRVCSMSRLVDNQLGNAIEAFNTCNPEMAKHVIENDNKVDTLDIKIDKLCQNIFALQQPVATDLRFIISSLKMNNDLERIGDHAVNIAKRVDEFSNYLEFSKWFGLDQVARHVIQLYQKVNDLIHHRQMDLAVQVFHDAALIKDSCHKISERIIEEMMHKSEVIVVATNLMIVLNLLERVASYSTNIAESVAFIIDGKIIKHQKKPEPQAE